MKIRKDLVRVTGLLLKACPILKRNLPHACWLEYLHEARYTAHKLHGKERDILARTAGCSTFEKAIEKAEN